MGKNIVICCDGTGNDFGARNSNVVKLFALLEKTAFKQVVYYDPGVGTSSSYDAFLPLTKTLKRLVGNAFGYGITQNVMDAYSFLMRHYEEGDKVFLFGFSRGAYTIRVLAGLVNRCGILYPDNSNLIPESIRIFKNTDKESWRIANSFKNTFCRPGHDLKFMGLWDTVTSYGWIYSPISFPYTTQNKSIETVCHAISLDERRAFFPQNLFGGNGNGKVKQVWFAGVHSDIGGGYLPARSGLGNLTLEWMLLEAKGSGLLFNEDDARKMVSSIPDNHLADQNEELKGGWLVAEVLPKLKKIPKNSLGAPLNWLYSWTEKDFVPIPYFNLGRRRNLKKVLNLTLHESLAKRIAERPDYRPCNLVKKDGSFKYDYLLEPWKNL
ncbi:MAG: DUF2235 domain-containing protein [Saprospiraceae bacterium]|nr:DUF2235 domain-containing protein [Saprospiraceae bacterium]